MTAVKVVTLSPAVRRLIKAISRRMAAGDITPAAGRAQVRCLALRAVAS